MGFNSLMGLHIFYDFLIFLMTFVLVSVHSQKDQRARMFPLTINILKIKTFVHQKSL